MKFLFLICCSFFCMQTLAQNSLNKKSQASFNKAQEFIQQAAYDQAIPLLENSLQLDSNFQLAYIQLGDIYRKKKQHQQAALNYLAALKIKDSAPSITYFNLAETELNMGNYQQARAHFEQYLSLGAIANETKVKAEKYLLDCKFAIEAVKHPVTFNPINMGPAINSVYRDYFPTLTADGQTIIFTRQIDGNEDFYTSKKINGIWQEAMPLSNNINTSNFNEGAQSISPDGNYLFFTGCNRPTGYGRCDIYIAVKEGNGWSKPVNLGPPINTPYWESQPAISPDGSTLYFVSNRPGGYGGFDLYKSQITSEGKWGNPENLGPNINTPYDENTPFMHPDGTTLYFTSDGWPGFGGKDIFFSKLSAGKWSIPTNAGYPINTYNEESGLTVNAAGTEALFSAERAEGYGNHDIYSFKIPESIKPIPTTFVKGIVKDADTKETLSAWVVIENLKINQVLFKQETEEEIGTFLAVMPIGGNYSLTAKSADYLFYSQNFSLNKDTLKKSFEIEVLLKKINVGAGITLNNIFFDTNKYNLLPASLSELKNLAELLRENPTINIEIGGHTDNTGEDSFNEKLALNRAKAVFDYLVEEKIDKDRLSFKGYGKSMPIADNQSEAGRQTNRRTTFKIIKL